jgi:hypothetical protein
MSQPKAKPDRLFDRLITLSEEAAAAKLPIPGSKG